MTPFSPPPHLSTATSASNRPSWRRAGVMLAVAAVCGWGSVSADAKPMSATAVQSRTIRADDSGVVLLTRRGDSLREIAQYYSRQHNVPFQRSLDVLIQTNQSRFPEGDPNRMQVGTELVLPKWDAAGAAVVTAAPVASSTAVDAPSPTAPVPVAPATGAVETKSAPVPATPANDAVPAAPVVTESSHRGVWARLQAKLAQLPRGVWWGIVPLLLLGGWLLGRSARRKVTDEAIESVEAVAPIKPIEPTSTASVAGSTEVSPQNQVAEGQVLSPTSNEPMPAQEVTNAVAEQTPCVEPLAKIEPQAQEPNAHTSVTEAELPSEPVDVMPEAAQEIEFRFKQALHGLTADQLDLRSTSADAPAATAPAGLSKVASVPSEQSNATASNVVVASATGISSTGAPSAVNVHHLLRQYADHTVEQAGQPVNYYALSERTRLQKWMSTQSMDDLLDHAQKAYAQSYPNVAHHMLNEVILRGDAAQSTHALDLRNQWHIQYLRQQAQEQRGH